MGGEKVGRFKEKRERGGKKIMDICNKYIRLNFLVFDV